MGKMKTLEDFKNDVHSLVGDDYTVLGDKYLGNKIKIKIRHNICGFEYDVRPNDFISGCRCPKCSGKVRKNTEYFKNEVRELVGDEYSVLGEYKRTHSKILFQHNTCGNQFEMTPHHFLSGQRCPKCQHRSWAKTTDEFKKDMYDLVEDEYQLLDEYINSKTKVTLYHKSCGKTYTVMPSDFLQGYRCPYCYGNIKLTQKEFEKRVYQLYQDEYTVLGKYINSATKIKIRHNKCGNEWYVRPRDFISKQSGCPLCSRSKGELRIENYLKTHSIVFDIEHTYAGLIGINGGLLRYDFYLPDYNVLIEYQGQFHDGIQNEYVAKNIEYRKYHDKLKKDYAKNNHILLLEIWYWDYDNIEIILDNFFKKYKEVAINIA